MSTFKNGVSLQNFEEVKDLDMVSELSYYSESESVTISKISEDSVHAANTIDQLRNKKTVSSRELKQIIDACDTLFNQCKKQIYRHLDY